MSRKKNPDQIFLSYSRKDYASVNKLNKRLKNLNYTVWFDREDIQAGHLWRSQIVDGIEHCELYVIVLTANSIVSDNVRRELDLARAKRKSILPIVMDSEPLAVSKDMEYQLVGLQRVNYSDLRGDKLKSLVSDLTQITETVRMPVVAPSIAILQNDQGSPIQLKNKKKRHKVGRGPLADIDLTPWDRNHFISKEHAELNFSSDTWTIKACKSAGNPTLVNGKPVSHDSDVTLNSSDKITFADINFRFIEYAYDKDDA
ncbi:MAG: TIR domain-containing protein [Pseudomonadales bacterium]